MFENMYCHLFVDRNQLQVYRRRKLVNNMLLGNSEVLKYHVLF